MSSMKLLKFILILFLVIPSVFAQDQSQLVYSFEIKGINSSSKKSIYSEFLKHVEKKTKRKFEVVYLPPVRAMEEFLRNPKACLFPFNKDLNINDNDLLLSKPIGDVHLFAINKKGYVKVTNETLPLNKRIGLKTIYQNKIKFADDAIVYFLENDDQLFQMLRFNRIDVILESIPDVYLYFSDGKHGFDREFQYDKTQKIKAFDDYFACHVGFQNNVELIEMINKKVVH